MSDYKGKKKWKNSKEMQRKSTWTETAGSSDSHEVAASKLAFQFVRAGVSQTAVATTTQLRSMTRVESSAGEHLTFSMQSLRGIHRVTFT